LGLGFLAGFFLRSSFKSRFLASFGFKFDSGAFFG